MENSITKEERREINNKVLLPIMWLILVSLVMCWAGLTSAYVIRQAQGDWLFFDIPEIFFWSTGTIISSSFCFVAAQWFVKKRNHWMSIFFLVATFILGIIFCFLQYEGFLTLFNNGVYFTGPESNASGQYFNLFVFFHIAHIILGFIFLMIPIFLSLSGRYRSESYSGKYLGFRVVGTYWHFIGILWIYLILFLVFIR